MLKPFTRSFFTAVALLFVFATSSALGAHHSRSATTRAAHRASHRRKARKDARRHHRKHGSAAHPARSRRAHTPPVEPVSPVGPVSPVEPTPPIISPPPAPPTEPVVPVEPVEPVTPVPPAPTPPTASFTYSPASPVVGQAVDFDGASSSCTNSPCMYEWSEDGGPTRPIPPLWPLGSGQSLSFTFLEAGTKYVRLVVTDALGLTATTEQNVVVAGSPPPPAPTASAMPAISGTASEGQMLSATTGIWTGNPTAYAYQWRHCTSYGQRCRNIAGAVTSGYELASSDVGHTMSVTVTATNTGGSSSASSPVTAMVTVAADPPPPPPRVPTNAVLPAVSGSAVEGETLSASSGTWSGSPTSYVYQWQDCNSSGEGCSAISGATASSRVLTSSDVGHTLRVVVTAMNAGGSGEVTSTTTATVVADPLPPPAAPTNTALPTVSGSPVEGQTLSVGTGTGTGTWSGSPTSYAYQWQDCNTSGSGCSAISGATGSAYTLGAGDVGHTVRVIVEATNAGGSGEAASAVSATVTSPPLYSPSSPWNTPIPTSPEPELSPHNTEEIEAMDGRLGGESRGVEVGSWDFAPTIYYATASTPLVPVYDHDKGCEAVMVPIESGWRPDPSDEGHMAILAVNGTEYDFWRAAGPTEKTKPEPEGGPETDGCVEPGKWKAIEIQECANWKTGSAENNCGIHSSNTPEGAGAVTQKDLEGTKSYWPHALAFAYGWVCSENYSWCQPNGVGYPPKPAGGRGGAACTEEKYCIPNGTHIQLNPKMNCAIGAEYEAGKGSNEIDYKWEEQFCNTLRIYGAFLVDQSSSPHTTYGMDFFGQQFGSWTYPVNGWLPPYRTEHKAGAALGEKECTETSGDYLYGLFGTQSLIYPSWCVGEREAQLPLKYLKYMRVLKWE